MSESLQKCHHGKIRLAVEFEKQYWLSKYSNIAQPLCDCLRIMHSFSVTSANIAISDILLKLDGLNFYRKKFRCIFNHFYAMRPESYQIQWNNAK